MFQLFVNENQAQGVTGQAQAGITDYDSTADVVERGITVPWAINPGASWLDYHCSIAVHLDSGIVLHKLLPQSAQGIDTLSSQAIPAPPVAKLNTLIPGRLFDVTLGQPNPPESDVSGVNTVSLGKYQDIAQRMATSTYRFVLFGYGLRFGYQVPIPGLKSVAGIKPIPDQIQRVESWIESNYMGIPLWFAGWELWYFVTLPPQKNQLPPPNLAQHIGGQVELPRSIQVPYSQPDSNSLSGLQPVGPIRRVIR